MTEDESEFKAKKQELVETVKEFLGRFRGAKALPRDLALDAAAFTRLEPSKRDMIKGIMGLPAKNAREIMIPRVDVVCVPSTISLKALVKFAEDESHSRIPVYEETIDNMIGILHVKDLLRYIIERPKKFHLRKILHKPYFVPETMPLDELLLEYKKRRMHLAIVVDEYGGISGIITLEDILEEIVGEIRDEFDDDELPEVISVSKNTCIVDSRMTLSDFNEALGTSLPADEFDTIGGFVFDLFGSIPKKNESIRHKNLLFKISDIKGTRINRILVTVTPARKSV